MFFSDLAAMPLLILEKSQPFYGKFHQSSVQKVDVSMTHVFSKHCCCFRKS